MPCAPPPPIDAKMPASLPVTATLDVDMNMSPLLRFNTEIPEPAVPETSPAASIVTDPVPTVLTTIPLAPVTLATLIEISLLDLRLPAVIARPVPNVLVTLPVAVMSMSPLIPCNARIAAPPCADTRPADIEMPCEDPPPIAAEIPLSPPVTTTADVVTKMSPPPLLETEIAEPTDPETSPVGSIVTDPVPCVVTWIPVAPVTLATLTATSALLTDLDEPATIATAVPSVLSTLPVAVMAMSPLAELLAPIASPLRVDTRPTDIETPWEPVPRTAVEIPAFPPVTTTLGVVTKMSPPRSLDTEIAAPTVPKTSPVGSIVTDPVPYVVTSIPLAPATLATLTATSALLTEPDEPATITTAVPSVLSTLPVAVMAMSPLAELLAPIASPLRVDTRPTDIETPWEPVPRTAVEIPAFPPVTTTLGVVTKMSPPRSLDTEIAAPTVPKTSPVGSIVTDPVPYVVTSIPLAPATLATLIATSALLSVPELPT